MSSEEISLRTEVFEALECTLKVTLTLILEPLQREGVRAKLENLKIFVDLLQFALNTTLRGVTLPERASTSFYDLRRLLEGTAQTFERESEQNAMISHEVIYSMQGMAFSVLDQYVQAFEQMFEILSWPFDEDARLADFITLIRTLCREHFQGTDLSSLYRSVNIFVENLQVYSDNELQEDEDNEVSPEVHDSEGEEDDDELSSEDHDSEGGEDDDEVSADEDGRGASKKQIEANTIPYKYTKIETSSLRTRRTETEREEALPNRADILADNEVNENKDNEPPRKKIKTVHISTVNTEIAEECLICISSFTEGDFVRRLQCLHQFHRKCVDKWLKRNATCPNCRCSVIEEQPDFPLHLKGDMSL